jgi:UPF0716 family protein affecting phage T7 exclusion
VKRIARIVAGFALLTAGAAMVLLPGPGWVTIALGLALLAPDFPWAHNALESLKKAGNKGAELSRSWWRRLRTRSSVADDGRVK